MKEKKKNLIHYGVIFLCTPQLNLPKKNEGRYILITLSKGLLHVDGKKKQDQTLHVDGKKNRIKQDEMNPP